MNREKRLKILLVALLVGNLNQAFAQSIEKIRQELFQSGFENLRLIRTEGKLNLCLENISYRWQVLAIAESLDKITSSLSEPDNLEVIILEKGIPKLLIRVSAEDWRSFRNGNLPDQDFSSRLSVSSSLGDTWEKIKLIEAENRSAGKFDIIVYPQFAFKNTLLKKLYEVQVNVAPAIELSLWKGMNFTGQVIFPIINELGYEGGFIRPGYVTLSQEFRLPHQWFGRATLGNFNETRYGANFSLKHPFQNEKWSFELNAGLTGSSHFFDNKWTKSNLNTVTWSSSISYFYPHFNLEFKAGAAQYIYNDLGLFTSCTRYFGETAFGFYAMLGEKNTNGGFHLTIPFPIKKRGSRKVFRLSIPEHYEMSYDAGTEFFYGQSFRTRPDQNRINDNNFPGYLKNELIHLKK